MKHLGIGGALGILAAFVVTLAGSADGRAAEATPRSGPKTESCFPPLVVPTGFRATLFACDPLVEYPSVIAVGPRPDTVFVAHDYMTGLGIPIVRHDEVRLLADSDGDGYADKSTVFASGFNSIQGLAFHDGTVFVMHAPLLTALRDADGDGVADERRDLLNGLGLPPEQNEMRLHCANGVVVGHDGWLYLAVGDHGIDVPRPEGDRLVLHGGGILRCRPDGRELHVFATGLRNIYDIALDEELNVFVRDNENDGGDYMVRVCHSFHGADHGYPYRYYEHPEEALPPLADLGRGSSAGGVCYLETAFPPEYRGNLFFCEWGRSLVRYERRRAGSSFAPMQEREFASGAATDPYGFKPTDVIVDRDGSLLVSDWGDDQRPKRGRGRLYRIASLNNSNAIKEKRPTSSIAGLLKELDSPSYATRFAAQDALGLHGGGGLLAVRHALKAGALGPLGRMHAVWIVAHANDPDDVAFLLAIAKSDADPRVKVQAVRALADRCDPTLGAEAKRRSVGVAGTARALCELATSADPRVALEIVVALGRLRWKGIPEWLRDHLRSPDAALAHAALQALKRADNWPAVLRLLDEPDERPVRRLALAALAERADLLIVDGLISRMSGEGQSRRRLESAALLTRVHKNPGPWTYWGYRPGPRPVGVVAWERTETIEQTLDGVLADRDRDVRLAILRRMQREQIPIRTATLLRWLAEERAAERVAALLDELAKRPASETRDVFRHVASDRSLPLANRRRALSFFVGRLDKTYDQQILELAEHLEDGPVLVDLLRELGKLPTLGIRQLLLAKLDSPDVEIRSAAIDSAAAARLSEAAPRIVELLQDRDVRVRRAAALAAGPLSAKGAVGVLSALTRDPDPLTRRACFESLRELHDPTAAESAVAALADPLTQLAAIDYLADFGTSTQASVLATVAANDRSIDLLTGVIRALAKWKARLPVESPQRKELAGTIAELQGRSGVLLYWRYSALDSNSHLPTNEKTQIGTGPESRIDLADVATRQLERTCDVVTEFAVPGSTRAQFLASCSCPWQMTLNGRAVFHRESEGPFRADSDRFEANLIKGINRLVVRLDAKKAVTFHVRFRPLSSSAEQERLAQFALKNRGTSDRGRTIFLNSAKSLCANCHRIGDDGNSIGPNLTGVGQRFSRIHLIESILEPSRTIAPAFEGIAVVTTSGRTIIGVKVAETETTLTLGDETGKRQEVRKTEIEERTALHRSIMPGGLEKRLTDREFVDLLAYLQAQKRTENR